MVIWLIVAFKGRCCMHRYHSLPLFHHFFDLTLPVIQILHPQYSSTLPIPQPYFRQAGIDIGATAAAVALSTGRLHYR